MTARVPYGRTPHATVSDCPVLDGLCYDPSDAVPGVVYGPRQPLTRTHLLWLAVLWQAANDAHLNPSPIRTAARQWLHCRDDGLRTFVWICDLFGWDPDAIEHVVQRHAPSAQWAIRCRATRIVADTPEPGGAYKQPSPYEPTYVRHRPRP